MCRRGWRRARVVAPSNFATRGWLLADCFPCCLPGLSTMCNPLVRINGNMAVVSYTRAVQSVDGDGGPRTNFSHETRVRLHVTRLARRRAARESAGLRCACRA